MKLFNILAIAALATPSIALAQTVTVNKTATPDASTFNTISAALAAVEADLAEPNVVQVTDSGIYEEVINIETPVTLIGTAPERPTIELLSNPEGGYAFYPVSGSLPEQTRNDGGIVINLPDTMTTGTVKLHNLIVLPALNVAPENRLRMAIENQNNNLYLELDNVLITANENHLPLVTDGIESDILKLVPSNAAYDASVVPFGAHGIVLGRTNINSVPMYEGEGVEFLFKDSVITHLRNDYHPAATERERFPTCIIMHSPWVNESSDTNFVRKTHIAGDSGISNSRVGISAHGDLSLSSDGPLIQMNGHGNQAIRLDGPAFNYRTINDANISNNSNTGVLDRGYGPIRWSMKNCTSIISLNHIFLVETSGGPAVGQITIQDSTLVGGRHHASAGKAHTIRLVDTTECDLLFRNCILGGKLDHAEPIVPANPGSITPAEQHLMDIRNFNVISFAGTNTLTLEGTAVITEGPYAFRVNAEGESLAFSRGVNATLVGTPSTGADPLFVVVDPTLSTGPDFLDVQNTSYATANADGGPLGGGADYIGGVSNVSDWAIY